MNWEAPLAADARLAARNAVKIRAALRNSLNSDSIYDAYLSTQPASSGNLAQDRARARAWAIINVRLDLEAFKLVLLRIWATGYILGELAAEEALEQAMNKSAMITKKETDTPAPTPSRIGMNIDWSTWEPGDQVTAALLKPKKGLQRLIGAQNVTIKDMTSTTLNQLGNALGEAVAMGMSARTASRHIKKTLAHPSRALMIAITESNRAMNYAAVDRYKESGIQEMRWLVFDPCDICAQNANQVAPIGEPFKSGHIRPPAHPNCRCATAPIIPDFGQGVMGSVEEVPSPVPSQEAIELPQEVFMSSPEEQKQIIKDRMMEQRRKGFHKGEIGSVESFSLDYYRGNGYKEMNKFMRGQAPKADQIVTKTSKALFDLINKAPRNDKPFKVFRGIGGKAADLALSMKPGDLFTDAGFMSTSYNQMTSQLFLGTRNATFEITVPAGSKGIDMEGFFKDLDKEASLAAALQSEQEFLLQAGSTLKITEVNVKELKIKAVLMPHG